MAGKTRMEMNMAKMTVKQCIALDNIWGTNFYTIQAAVNAATAGDNYKM